MPDGSPIDQWWKSHLPARVSTNPKTATHAPGVRGRAYCGYRAGNQTLTTEAKTIDCADCLAALRADHA